MSTPLIVEEKVEAFLDLHGLGEGPITATRIGDGGGSNFTFLIERGGERFVLRRPPRPPLPPSAHDMVREAGLQNALRATGFTRLADIVAVCDDDSVLGVPFYVMRWLDGHVVTTERPPGLDDPHALGMDLVDTLVEIHAADVTHPELAKFARPGNYNERQVRRDRKELRSRLLGELSGILNGAPVQEGLRRAVDLWERADPGVPGPTLVEWRRRSVGLN